MATGQADHAITGNTILNIEAEHRTETTQRPSDMAERRKARVVRARHAKIRVNVAVAYSKQAIALRLAAVKAEVTAIQVDERLVIAPRLVAGLETTRVQIGVEAVTTLALIEAEDKGET